MSRAPVQALLPSLIDRYVAIRMLRYFALALSVVLTALLLERVLRLFNLFALKGGAPSSVVIELIANLVPYYLGLALPAAFFLSVFLTVAGMGDDNELDALLATGWSITRLSRPFFVIGVIFAVISVPLFGYLQPYSRYAYDAILYAATNAGWDARAQPATFIAATQGVTLRADSVDISGHILKGIFVRKKTRNGEQVTTAPSGILVLSNSDRRLDLYLQSGVTLEDRAHGAPDLVRFNELRTNVDVARGIHPFRDRGDSERELTLRELRRELRNPKSDVPHRKLASEFHARIVRALSLPILPLIAVPLAMAAKRQRRTFGIIIAALLLIGYHHILQLGESLADIGKLPAVPALWTPFVLFSIFSVWLFYNSRERPGDNPMTHVVERTSDLFDVIAGWIGRLRGKAPP